MMLLLLVFQAFTLLYDLHTMSGSNKDLDWNYFMILFAHVLRMVLAFQFKAL